MTEGRVDAIADKTSTPTYTRDLAQWLPRIFKSEEGGLLHLANGGQCTWQEYAQHALDCCRNEGIGLKAGTVGALKLEEMKNFVARRPRYTVLSTQRFQAITGEVPRSWRDAVAEYVRDYYSKK
jgi:dTDP-4-dehydrorhamnose reductase